MRCEECYWCCLNTATGSDRVCCNKDSQHYNEILSKEQIKESACEQAETEQAVDYRILNPWQFASKYYM